MFEGYNVVFLLKKLPVGISEVYKFFRSDTSDYIETKLIPTFLIKLLVVSQKNSVIFRNFGFWQMSMIKIWLLLFWGFFMIPDTSSIIDALTLVAQRKNISKSCKIKRLLITIAGGFLGFYCFILTFDKPVRLRMVSRCNSLFYSW